MLRLLHPTDTYSRDGNQRTNKRTLVFFSPVQFQSKKKRVKSSFREFASLGSPGSSSGQQQPSSSSPGRGLFLVSGAALLSSLVLMMELDPRLYENVVRSLLHALPSSVEGAIILFSLIRQTPSLYRD
jgi:hypothetical protein